MKKMKLKIAMVAVAAAVAGYTAYQNQTKEVAMSELALANVEALANNEDNVNGNTGPSELYDCPGLWTGDGVHCKCEYPNPCTAVLCH